jgi:hypothetical protein
VIWKQEVQSSKRRRVEKEAVRKESKKSRVEKETVSKRSSPVKRPSQDSQSRVVKEDSSRQRSSEKRGGLVGSHCLGRKIYQLEVL